MKKLIVIGLLVSNVAYADTTAYIQYIGSIMVGGAINTALKDYEQTKKPKEIKNVQVLPSAASTPFGKTCELRSVMVNGQVVTNNYCY